MRAAVTTLCLLSSLTLAQPRGLEAVFEKVDPSVVTVRVGLKTTEEGPDGYLLKVVVGTGSGILVHADGFVVTAAHVVEGAEQIVVQFKDGTQAEGAVVSLSRTEDLALLKVSEVPTSPAVAVLGNSDLLKVGQPVFAIGTPLGLGHTLTAGLISSIRTGKTQGLRPGNVIQTDAALNQGNSGGPVFNERGEVVGIASYIATTSGGSQGLGFAVPSNTVRKRLFDNPLPWLGLSLRHLPADVCALFNWPYASVMLIERVAAGSAGAKAGLRGGSVDAVIGGNPVSLGGDVIVKVGPFDASETEKIGLALAGLKAGDKVHYTVMREGKLLETDVEVPARIVLPKLAAPPKR
ncbi:MAG: trypsin family protein [Myxococcaceae bacterium]|nr:trypsin family protein [Myxococcaceae bacterium]